MWNLVRNLPAPSGFDHPPCFDEAHTFGRHLVNGHPYTQADLYSHVLTGQTPFEASARYSTELRELVKSCLAYHPDERPSLDELRNSVQLWMNDDTLETQAKGPLWLFVKRSLNSLRVGRPYQSARKRKREDDSDDEETESAPSA
jgi:serine/threonine protein kinase